MGRNFGKQLQNRRLKIIVLGKAEKRLKNIDNHVKVMVVKKQMSLREKQMTMTGGTYVFIG